MMIVLVTADNYLLMFVGPYSALYIREYISHRSINCWDILKLKTISRETKVPSETKNGIPYGFLGINLEHCKGKDIVQSFMWIKQLLRHSHQSLILSDIYTPYSYYSSSPVFIFKRHYTSKPSNTEISKFTKKYKQEYELTQEQRDALIGIMLADGFLTFFFTFNWLNVQKKSKKEENLLIIQELE